MGFPIHVIKTIFKYRQNGGVFKKKEDLLRIYGLDSAFYRSIESYIALPNTTQKEVPQNGVVPSKPKFSKKQFDINTADTVTLQQLYGIGPKLSKRIILYREKLGGFVSKEQFYEIYGLDSMVINRLAIACYIEDDFAPKQLNINEVSQRELESHPYVTKNIAKAIVQYRFQHGKFADVRDLNNIQILDTNLISKVSPYLMVR
jgi:competence protein ComEA